MTYDPLDTGPTDNNADDVLESLTTDKLNNADFTTASDGEVLTKTATGDEVAFEASGGGAFKYEQGDSLTEYVSEPTASGDSWSAVFDKASTVDVLWGFISGNYVTHLRVTWGDNTTALIGSDAFHRGNDSGSNTDAGVVVPHIKAAKKLEFFNSASSQVQFGVQVFATG